MTNEFGEPIYEEPEQPTVAEALAAVFEGNADKASLEDLLLFGAYYDWAEKRNAGGESCSFKLFAYDHGKVAKAVGRQDITSDMMSDLFMRLEKQVRQLLVPRTYGAGNQNLGDVDMSIGKITVGKFTRDPSRFTPFGHMVGRWARIMTTIMNFPPEPDAAEDYVQFLDGIEVSLEAQHAAHSAIVARRAANAAKAAAAAFARGDNSLLRLGRRTAKSNEE
ncbi:MAG: hypothetical protein ABS75_25930 [Pelagibacterium sp. SCN 63-23]|nr:MAG: hypothetical protein ABS75_25930 [Pelagibacterium sp. SCN 63-23]